MIVITVGFEPTPVKTSALNWRLRPLGHVIYSIGVAVLCNMNWELEWLEVWYIMLARADATTEGS